MQTKTYHFCVSATTPSYIGLCSQGGIVLVIDAIVLHYRPTSTIAFDTRPITTLRSSSRVCFHYKINPLQSNRWVPGPHRRLSRRSRPGKAAPPPGTESEAPPEAAGRPLPPRSQRRVLPPPGRPGRLGRERGPARGRGNPEGGTRPASGGAEAGPVEGSARPAALPARAADRTAQETPPRPRRPAAHRARAAAPARAGPGLPAPIAPRAAAGSGLGRPLARTHQGAAGAGHGPARRGPRPVAL